MPRSPRTRTQHFSDAEKALIRIRHGEGIAAAVVAAEVGCSTRNVNKYYAMFEGRGAVGGAGRAERVRHVIKAKPKAVMVDRAARFYKSNFEPS